MPVRQESLFFSLCHKGKIGNKLKLQPITLANTKRQPMLGCLLLQNIQFIQLVCHQLLNLVKLLVADT